MIHSRELYVRKKGADEGDLNGFRGHLDVDAP